MLVKIIQFDVLNGNGRIYSREGIKSIFKKNKYSGEMGLSHDCLGPTINLDNVSHVIKKLQLKGDFLVGEVVIKRNEFGKKLKKELKDYVFRTRAIGCVNDDHQVTIDELLAIDAIHKDYDSFNGIGLYGTEEDKLKEEEALIIKETSGENN